MKLILTEYIDSLKEDGELDILIQDILKAHGITIFAKPERGRQYGVDIYAVGKDFEDNDIEKVFLVTVKQGDVDRQNWQGNQNALHPSLEDIKDVFIRSNLASQHRHLPIKIVIAFNGVLKQNMEQNWRGYAERNTEHDYSLWNSGWLVQQFEAKLLSEDAFSTGTRSLIRKTIIHVENPNYKLADFDQLLREITADFKKARSKKARLRILRELHVIVSIILKFAEREDNLMHSVRIAEKYILVLWSELIPGDPDKEYTLAFIAGYDSLRKVFLDYFNKIEYVCGIRDGFSRSSSESAIYTFTVYEQIGIIATTGLILVQLKELIGGRTTEEAKILDEALSEKANEVANALIMAMNNNPIVYSPLADEHHIEICLVLIFLCKLGQRQHACDLLLLFNKQMGEGLLFSNIFPDFSNSLRMIAELEMDFEKRRTHEYQASNMFTVLSEWAAVLDDEDCYQMYVQFKQNLISKMDLLLWFPDESTEEKLYTQNATMETGYALSNCELLPSLSEYRDMIAKEYASNCAEKKFSFINQGVWSIGLIASRHYRTYIFPHYWRQFLQIPE